MADMKVYPVLIEPEEALKIHEYSTVQEIENAYDLCMAFCKSPPSFVERKAGDPRYRVGGMEWPSVCLLAFAYGTGRIQGMREERAKRKTDKPEKEPATRK